MIFRTIAYSTHESWFDANAMERVVFVDAQTRNEAKQTLHVLLSQLWRVPEDSLEFYNLESEFEVLSRAVGQVSTGDLRLFEIGTEGGKPLYIGAKLNDQPLLLLTESLQRLTMAYLQVAKE